MHRALILAGRVVLPVLLAACEGPIAPDRAIVLPPGDVERGREAFVSLECTACHRVSGLDLPAPETAGPVSIPLGGEVTRVESYGELVTSVINPSHRLARSFRQEEITQDGESIMPVYNDVMTVTQLIDIVAFLQSRYDVVPRPGYRYPVYDYRKD